MNEKELQVAIDQLTAMSDFAMDLRVKLTEMLNTKADAPAPEIVEAKAPKQITQKVTIAEEEVPAIEAPVLVLPPSVDLKAIADKYELGEMKIGELRDYLTDCEIEFPAKAKKPDLITIVCEAIADGRIPLEDDDATDEAETEVDADEVVVEDDSDETGYEASDERVESENQVEDKIRSTYPKKLKVSAIKKFLKTYYDGDAEMANLDDFEDEQLLEMYIEIQQSLVDDEGDTHEMEEAYFRDDVIFCCGKETKAMEDTNNIYCEVCGNEYEG